MPRLPVDIVNYSEIPIEARHNPDGGKINPLHAGKNKEPRMWTESEERLKTIRESIPPRASDVSYLSFRRNKSTAAYSRNWTLAGGHIFPMGISRCVSRDLSRNLWNGMVPRANRHLLRADVHLCWKRIATYRTRLKTGHRNWLRPARRCAKKDVLAVR